MKVRALPTWRNPVGEGAKRTRGEVAGDIESAIVLSMILAPWVCEQVPLASPVIQERARIGGVYD